MCYHINNIFTGNTVHNMKMYKLLIAFTVMSQVHMTPMPQTPALANIPTVAPHTPNRDWTHHEFDQVEHTWKDQYTPKLDTCTKWRIDKDFLFACGCHEPNDTKIEWFRCTPQEVVELLNAKFLGKYQPDYAYKFVNVETDTRIQEAQEKLKVCVHNNFLMEKCFQTETGRGNPLKPHHLRCVNKAERAIVLGLVPEIYRAYCSDCPDPQCPQCHDPQCPQCPDPQCPDTQCPECNQQPCTPTSPPQTSESKDIVITSDDNQRELVSDIDSQEIKTGEGESVNHSCTVDEIKIEGNCVPNNAITPATTPAPKTTSIQKREIDDDGNDSGSDDDYTLAKDSNTDALNDNQQEYLKFFHNYHKNIEKPAMYSPGNDKGPVACSDRNLCRNGYTHSLNFQRIIPDPSIRNTSDDNKILPLYKSVSIEIKRAINSFLKSFDADAGNLPYDDKSRLFSNNLEENFNSLYKLKNNQELSPISLLKIVITILLDTGREVRIDRIFNYQSTYYQFYFSCVQMGFIITGLIYFIGNLVVVLKHLVMGKSEKKRQEKMRQRSEEMVSLQKELGNQIKSLERRVDHAFESIDDYNIKSYANVMQKYPKNTTSSSYHDKAITMDRIRSNREETDRLLTDRLQ